MTLMRRFAFIPAAILSVLAFISCDDDFTTIGGELIGGQLENLPKYEAGVVAYNNIYGPVQTNNLPAHLLGVYKEPVYGLQIANVLTQVSLSANNPTFGNEPRLDSVVLSLPYFSTAQENDEQGNAVYRLDSVYGDAPFRLVITRSNLFLNDFDPDADFENRQRYFSNQGPIVESSLIGDPLYVNENFIPSAEEVEYLGRDEAGGVDTLRVSPRLRAHLPVEFFQENILNKAGSPELANNNNFKNFLRGLYFQALPVNGDGNMLLLNFNHADAGIFLYYTVISDDEDAEDEEEQRSFRLNFGTNIFNTFTQEFPAPLVAEIAESNAPPGAENLYLKGGEGTMAIIELFEDEAELEDLRSRNWLINEASLTFHVNQDIVSGGETEPSRIYLYNLEQNTLLADYPLLDNNARSKPENAVTGHLQPLQRDEDGNGLQYKIRITEHVRRILQEDADNVKLGLVVMQNVTEVNNAILRNPGEVVRRVPVGTVMSPKGTVLYGNLAADEDKRLKLNIFYTETDN